jgi:hypothetical protein
MKACTCPECEALKLGCEIHERDGRWHWSHGRHARSSNDHYGVSFKTAMEAGAHFLKTREGIRAAASNN